MATSCKEKVKAKAKDVKAKASNIKAKVKGKVKK